MKIGGFVPFTTIDYPGMLSAVIFTQGCPWRCGYCHNTHLQDFHIKPTLPWERVLTFLKSRQSLLEAVTFSGGEPTLQTDLLEAICEIRELGFKIGLHTAGISLLKLQKVLPFIDWIGMDIKAPFDNYKKITGVFRSGKEPLLCAKAVIASGIPYQFRTTVDPNLLSEKDIQTITKQIKELGGTEPIWQKVRYKT